VPASTAAAHSGQPSPSTSHCSIRSFSYRHLDVLGGDFYSINIACLDNVEDTELAGAPVRYMDGRNNNWYAPPAETRHL
jgi:hypothetical protein